MYPVGIWALVPSVKSRGSVWVKIGPDNGRHKLIKYGFIIHGFIDGNCHMVRCMVRMFVLGFLTFNIRSLRFVPVPTTLLVLSSNCSYQLQGYIVPHPGFIETEEGKMCLFLCI